MGKNDLKILPFYASLCSILWRFTDSGAQEPVAHCGSSSALQVSVVMGRVRGERSGVRG
jgi:hypothetical protein